MKAVIFDLGSVLIAYDHGTTLAAVADGAGITVDRLRAYIDEMGQDLTTGAFSVRHLYDILVEDAGATFAYDDYQHRLCSSMARDDGALAYAVELQNRPETTVAVISNTNDGHVRWLDEHIPELKEVDLVIMSNEVGMAKPDAAIYRLALELIDLPPEDAIFVDDLAPNVRAAEALGLAGIVHTDWAVTRPQLERWLSSRNHRHEDFIS